MASKIHPGEEVGYRGLRPSGRWSLVRHTLPDSDSAPAKGQPGLRRSPSTGQLWSDLVSEEPEASAFRPRHCASHSNLVWLTVAGAPQGPEALACVIGGKR